MSDWFVWSSRPDNEQLQQAAELLRRQPGTLVFVEGPTECQVLSAADWPPEKTNWDGLWQLRIFSDDYELAARRLEFTAGGRWQARFIGQGNPPGDGWGNVERLAASENQQETHVYLHGQYKAADEFVPADGFYEDRFRQDRSDNADLQFPTPRGHVWQAKDVAKLIAVEHPHQGGGLVRWCRVGHANLEQLAGDKR